MQNGTPKININFSISHLTLRHKGRRNSTRPWTQQGKERNQSHKLLSLLPNVACMMEIPAHKKKPIPREKKICSIFSSLILDAGGVRKSFFPSGVLNHRQQHFPSNALFVLRVVATPPLSISPTMLRRSVKQFLPRSHPPPPMSNHTETRTDSVQ